MKKELFDKNAILKLSFDLSLMGIDYFELPKSNKKFVVAGQLLKSGTSIGANAMKAQNPECKADFSHKVKNAAKEAEESQYWLWLCDDASTYPDCRSLKQKLEEIIEVPAKILSTAKRKSPFSYLMTFFM